MPQNWINTIPFGSGHTLGTFNHGLEPLFCCFITHFGVGSSLVTPGAPWCTPGAPLDPLEPPWPLVCHPLPYTIILGHYGSYLTHLEWIIQAFTLQYIALHCSAFWGGYPAWLVLVGPKWGPVHPKKIDFCHFFRDVLSLGWGGMGVL